MLGQRKDETLVPAGAAGAGVLIDHLTAELTPLYVLALIPLFSVKL